MIDHSDNTLIAAINSLSQTVAPALKEDDPQAKEQLTLTIQFLELLRSRLHDLHSRHLFELRHRTRIAESLLPDAKLVSEKAAEELHTALGQATELQRRPDATTDEARAASQELWRAVRGMVRSARGVDAETRLRIQSTVTAGVAPLVEMESAWYTPYGFVKREPDSKSLHQLLQEGRRETP